MRKLVLAVLAVAAAARTLALQPVTVAELEARLRQEHKRSDKSLASLLQKLELTERLTDEHRAALEPLLPGENSRTAFTVLADLSQFRDLPQADVLPGAALDPAAQKALADRAADYAANTVRVLPRFIATRSTARYQSVDPARVVLRDHPAAERAPEAPQQAVAPASSAPPNPAQPPAPAEPQTSIQSPTPAQQPAPHRHYIIDLDAGSTQAASAPSDSTLATPSTQPQTAQPAVPQPRPRYVIDLDADAAEATPTPAPASPASSASATPASIASAAPATPTPTPLPQPISTQPIAIQPPPPIDTSRPFREVDGAYQNILYRDQKEIVEDVQRADTSQSAPRGMEDQGEFGPFLRLILSDVLRGAIQWSHWERGPSGKLAVFRFSVPRADSHFLVRYCCVPLGGPFITREVADEPPYTGEVAIDPATGAVHRIALRTSPHGMPIDWTEMAIDYAFVDLGGQKYLCPSRAITISSARPPIVPGAKPVQIPQQYYGQSIRIEPQHEISINHVRFDNFHLYQSEMRIVPGSVVPQQP